MNTEPIRDGWARYRYMVLAPGFKSGEVLDEARLAFFAGAFHLWYMLATSEPKDQAQLIDAIGHEMRSFATFVNELRPMGTMQ
ncbi:hypothetical protein ACVMGC_001073 [Bradyrhizobium barranii subsp. barranii]|uniref:hypothetical protein n=1 Tax=Bradyrhizobium TaxID=374 RepID=UPI001BA49DE2|nr:MULTISPECIES: hypothetical protein [Bradyrhizobium]MBR0879668.1 hypothetical protein [Bradyrhizobium liaoningense]MCP1778777.1 hypothetical protein [Bradyrhizobium japonicum]MCP1958225.1 hypothetical protein [Bradyrhizobium japonicum]